MDTKLHIIIPLSAEDCKHSFGPLQRLMSELLDNPLLVVVLLEFEQDQSFADDQYYNGEDYVKLIHDRLKI